MQNSALIGELYQQFRDEDGFIYIMYSGENTFGAEHPLSGEADVLSSESDREERKEEDRQVEVYSKRPDCVGPEGI